MKLFYTIFFLTCSFFIQAQETVTLTTETTQEQKPRIEISEKYDNGTKKQEIYYTPKNKKIKVINYYKNGETSSIYTLNDQEKKDTYTKYFEKTGIINQQSTYHSNNIIKSKIINEPNGKLSYFYFYHEDANEKFRVGFKYGKIISKTYFNSKGSKIKNVGYNSKGNKAGEVYWANGRYHGWSIKYNEDGSVKSKKFAYKGNGVTATYYDGWEKEIFEYDKLPELEKELDALLKEYKLI